MLLITKVLSALPYIIATIFAVYVYNVFIENPMVRREALAGYVQEVRLIAANAKILELDRQRRAAQNASAAFNKAIIEEREAIKILEVDYERRINELLKEESGPETTTTTKPFILTNKDVKIITGAK